jgi:polyisoprenyl-phosphate glycosyltransferase
VINQAKISIVIPVFNETDMVVELTDRLQDVLDNVPETYELLFVDDGSTDDTLAKLKLIQEKWPDKVCLVEFSRNFGHEAALSAGLKHARGEAVIPIDADLQDPPELIPKLIEKWKSGFDVVLAQREKRKGETFLKKKTADLFYKLMGQVSESPIPKNTGNFRLLDRKVVKVINGLPEHNRFMKGVFAWPGFKSTTVLFEREARFAGESKFPFLKMWRYALDGIFSFSNLPLRIWSYVGIGLSLMSFLVGITLTVVSNWQGSELPSYQILMLAMFFLGGVQLISVGILGEYVGRIYDESKNRPLYVVRKTYGFEASAPAEQKAA